MSSPRPATVRVGLTTTKPDTDKYSNYVRAVERAGGTAVPILPGRSTADEILGTIDALVLTGGGDVAPSAYGSAKHPKTDDVDPARDGLEIELVLRAKELGVPTLCVCRGLQVLNVALEGTLTQHLPDEVGGSVPHVGANGKDGIHAVKVDAGTHLAKILGATETSPASSHHQAIDRLAEGLRVVARSPGDRVIEAVEVEGHPWMIGVQWHPERSDEACQQKLFDDLVRTASEARTKRSASGIARADGGAKATGTRADGNTRADESRRADGSARADASPRADGGARMDGSARADGRVRADDSDKNFGRARADGGKPSGSAR